MDGYRVEPDALRNASGKIADAIGSADDLAVEKVAEHGSAFGNDAISSSLNDFCSTWELAKGILQQRSASAGEALDGAAKAYEEREEQNKLAKSGA